MTKRTRRNHTPAFKAKVAIAGGTVIIPAAGSHQEPDEGQQHQQAHPPGPPSARLQPQSFQPWTPPVAPDHRRSSA